MKQCEHFGDQKTCWKCDPTNVIALMDRKPSIDHLASFYGTIRDAARLTDNITLAERIAVLDVVRAELVRDFQAKIDEAEG